jgi:tetratricopeptide (TPR) repeat protein
MKTLMRAFVLLLFSLCCASPSQLTIHRFKGNAPEECFSYGGECRSLVDSVQTALDYNHLQGALALLTAAEQERHTSGELLALKGDVFYRQNQLDSAKTCFENALRLSDSSADSESVRDIKTSLGMVHYELKEYSKASRYFGEGSTHRNNQAFGRFLRYFKGRTPYRLKTTNRATRVRIVDVDPFPKVTVNVNGRSSNDFILDTGCNFVSLSSDFAKKCGINRLERLESGASQDSDGVKRSHVELAIIDSLQVGAFVFYDVPAAILDSNAMSFRVLGITLYKLEGALGLPLMKEVRTTVNYEEREVKFELPQAERTPGSIPNLAIVDNVLYTRAQFNECAGFNVFVDSGTKHSAITQPALSLLDSSRVRFAKPRRGDREHSNLKVKVISDCVPEVFVIDDCAVGNLKFEVIADWQTRGGRSLKVQAIVAKDLLRHFITTYDFVNMRLELTPVQSD